MPENAQALRVIHNSEKLIEIGKRSISAYGYTNEGVEAHLCWHLTQLPSKKWCSPDCMSRTMFGRNTDNGRRGVRKRIANTFRVLLKRGLFLAIEYDASPSGHGEIMAFKLFENGEGAESQYALAQIERMTRRRKLSEEMRERALQVIGVKQESTHEPVRANP